MNFFLIFITFLFIACECDKNRYHGTKPIHYTCDEDKKDKVFSEYKKCYKKSRKHYCVELVYGTYCELNDIEPELPVLIIIEPDISETE